jgi:hypothetical protein
MWPKSSEFQRPRDGSDCVPSKGRQNKLPPGILLSRGCLQSKEPSRSCRCEETLRPRSRPYALFIVTTITSFFSSMEDMSLRFSIWQFSLNRVKLLEGALDEQIEKWMSVLREQATQNSLVTWETWARHVPSTISFGHVQRLILPTADTSPLTQLQRLALVTLWDSWMPEAIFEA